MNKKFMDRIKELRTESGFTQEKLGNMLGITKTGISYWESGTSVPNDEMLIKISNLFKVSTDYLLGKSDVRNNDAVDMDSFQVAFYNETKEMSEEMKNQVLDYVRFLRNKGK